MCKLGKQLVEYLIQFKIFERRWQYARELKGNAVQVLAK